MTDADDEYLPEHDVLIPLLQARTSVDPISECWVWTGYRTTKGYGRVWLAGKMRNVHRLAYRVLVDPGLPHELVVDHVAARGCVSKACWNPAHLEAVASRENIMRGTAESAKQARKTHCIRGHEFGPESIDSRGFRRCRLCVFGLTPCEKCGEEVTRGTLRRHQRGRNCV